MKKQQRQELECAGDIRLLGRKLSEWAQRLNDGELAIYRGVKYCYYVRRVDNTNGGYLFEVRRVDKKHNTTMESRSRDWVYAVNHLYCCTCHTPTDYAKRPRVMFLSGEGHLKQYLDNWNTIINNN